MRTLEGDCFQSFNDWFKINHVKRLKNSSEDLFTTWLFETKTSFLLVYANNFDDNSL